MTYFEEYREACRTGKIIVGMEMLDILDLLWERMHDDRFIYDVRVAHSKIEFMERFCTQGKAPFYGKPLDLMLWQKAFLEYKYSLRWKETGCRVTQKTLLLIGRKNGKTTLIAADEVSEMVMGEAGQDIVCASNDFDTAEMIWEEAGGMIERLDPKRKRFRSNLRFKRNNRTGSKLFKMSERTKSKDGRNISKADIDEIHDMQRDEIYDALWRSMSSKIERDLTMITTQGFIDNGLLDNQLLYARSVISGEIDDPSYLPFLYTQDSEAEIYTNPQSWYKSNPSLGVTKQWDFLETTMKESKILKSSRLKMLTKDFNFKQLNSESWLEYSDLDYDSSFNIEDYRGAYGIIGADLSQSTDLTNVKVILMKKGSSKKAILSMYWIPEDKLLNASKDEANGADYETWVKQGYIKVCQENLIDLTTLAQWLISLYDDYGIQFVKCGYDPRFANVFRDSVQGYFGDITEKIYQSSSRLSLPMQYVEKEIKSRDILFNNNPVDRWCLLNTVLKMDRYDNISPCKINPARRIDGAATLIIAYATLLNCQSEYRALVEGGTA